MRFQEVYPLPKTCQECQDVKECRARGEGEWCCEECDHLWERFPPIPGFPQLSEG